MKSVEKIKESLKDEYPFVTKYLDIDGYKYHYVFEGQGDETLLCVHGNPTWSYFYRNVIKSLSPHFRVVVPDHIGCGLSDKPQDYEYTVQNHIDNLVTLIEILDLESIHLIVHDWGGAIGLGAALKFSERIKKITILNTAAFLVPFIPFRINICKLPIFGPLAIRGFNAFAGAAVHMASQVKGAMTPEVKKGFLAPYDSWHNRIATLRFVQDIPMKESHVSWETMKKIEEGIQQFRGVPMKIFWGAKDFCFNKKFLKEWEKRFPEAEVKIYEQAGHYLLEDAKPQIIDEIKQWNLQK